MDWQEAANVKCKKLTEAVGGACLSGVRRDGLLEIKEKLEREAK